MTRTRVAPLLLLACTPAIANAQADVSAELKVAGANTLVGAATAGLTALITGQPFTRATLEGALGGSIVYSGKRIASARFDGAGLAGRTVAAIGSSVVRNSGSGRGPLDELVLPVGPVVLHWTTKTPRSVGRLTAKLDIAQAAFAGYLAVHDGYRLDWRSSLSSGVPVFQANGWVGGMVGRVPRAAYERFGVIAISGPTTHGPRAYETLLIHERIHVIQHDYLSTTIAEPIDTWLFGLLPGGDVLGRYVEIGASGIAVDAFLGSVLPYSAQPWEREAYHLDGRP